MHGPCVTERPVRSFPSLDLSVPITSGVPLILPLPLPQLDLVYQSSILNFPSPPWRVNWLLICWLWFQEPCLETEITISSLRRERYVMLFWALAAVSWTHSTAGSSIVIDEYLILHGSCTRVRYIEVLRSDSLGEILQPTGTVNIAYNQLFYTQILVPLANRDGC